MQNGYIVKRKQLAGSFFTQANGNGRSFETFCAGGHHRPTFRLGQKACKRLTKE